MAKLRIVISKCLGFADCRYNGEPVDQPVLAPVQKLAQELGGKAEFIPICPEMELGLGCPRPRICVVWSGVDGPRLVQPATGRDLTADMARFCDGFLGGLGEVHGFILKSRSPSCGLGNVKRFAATDLDVHVDRSATGFFARAVRDRFPGCPVVDELVLQSPGARDVFLARARGCR